MGVCRMANRPSGAKGRGEARCVSSPMPALTARARHTRARTAHTTRAPLDAPHPLPPLTTPHPSPLTLTPHPSPFKPHTSRHTPHRLLSTHYFSHVRGTSIGRTL
eukprot:5579287-Prymnesium_polylepis.1